MTEMKKYLSLFGTFCLMVLPAWAFARLVDSWFRWPVSFALCIVLLLEFIILWYIRHIHGRGLSIKGVIGILFCVVLAIILGFGLTTSISYVVSYLVDGSVGTSFPWYTGFALAMIYAGPVLLISGIAWIVLHLREKKRNIRDVRLLFFLLIIGTALWAVIWTVERIGSCIQYPHAYNHPWHATFIFALLYFGPGLLIEGCVYILARRFESKLTPEDLAEEAPAQTPGKQPVDWTVVREIISTVAVPLIVFAVITACEGESRYLWRNIVHVICASVGVCLLIGLPALLICHRFGSGRLRDMRILTWILILLTFGVMALWLSWYSQNRLSDLSGLPSNTLHRLVLGFFGPIILGEWIALKSIRVVLNRTQCEPAGQKRGFSWVMLLAAVLAVQCSVLWFQFSHAEYYTELEVTAVRVTNNQSLSGVEGKDHILVDFRADHDSAWVYDSIQETNGDGIYLTFGTTWNPIREIGAKGTGYNLYPDESITKIYVYEPGAGFELILVRDSETGLWEYYE